MAADPNENEDVGAAAAADGPKLNDMIVIGDPGNVTNYPYPGTGSRRRAFCHLILLFVYVR